MRLYNTAQVLQMRALHLDVEHRNTTYVYVRVAVRAQVIYLTGWAPHSSQQRAARRGTATASFEVLLHSDDLEGPCACAYVVAFMTTISNCLAHFR